MPTHPRRIPMALLLTLLACPAAGAPVPAPPIIPVPKKLVLQGGVLRITAKARIVCHREELAPLAKILADDIARTHRVSLSVAKGPHAKADEIEIRLVTDDPFLRGPDAYRLKVNQRVVLEAGCYDAAAMGAMTLLQALRPDADGTLTLPWMLVEDRADKPFRAVQVCIKNQYHSPQWVKRVVDLLRFFKIRLLELHTAESMWIGCVMDSTSGVPEKDRMRSLLWTKAEMDDVIAYAAQRGVFLFPHNESVPHYAGMKNALTRDFNTTDTFAGFMDEFDGKGPYEVKGSIPRDGDPRYWAFVKEVTQRSYAQFAAGWPDGKLPYYHMGPVYGEGGTTPENAVRLLTFLKEKNPDVHLMYWSGPAASHPVLKPHAKNIVGAYYSRGYGAPPGQLFKDGGEIINVSGDPLYFAVGWSSPRTARQNAKRICETFHVARLNGIDCTKWSDQVLGAMLPTWEMRPAGHIEALLECVPFFAEHVWNVRPFPYPDTIWPEIAGRYHGNLEVLIKRQICERRPPSPTQYVTATQGLHPDRVEILWAAGDNFPEYFEVYRGEKNDPAAAKAVAGRIEASAVDRVYRFEDRTAEPKRRYFYWVKNSNPYGASEFGKPAQGYAGQAPVAVQSAYEPFDYKGAAGPAGWQGGAGWAEAWTEKNVLSATLGVAEESLTYPGLKTQGGRLTIRRCDPKIPRGKGTEPYMSLARRLAGKYGADGTEVWMSFLLKGTTSGNNTLAIRFGRGLVGRQQYSGRFMVDGVTHTTRIVSDRTFFVVTRTVFHSGNDLLHCWLNPAVGARPADEDAVILSRRVDNRRPGDVEIGMYAYNVVDYDIDEIRIGKTYAEVAPSQ